LKSSRHYFVISWMIIHCRCVIEVYFHHCKVMKYQIVFQY
jgi:hypothetical protein